MAFFYLLHEVIDNFSIKGSSYIQRNCRVFLLGVFLYGLLYIVLMNLNLMYPGNVMIDACRSVFFAMLFADCAVMACIYKDHFGRSILNEVKTAVEDKAAWDYDQTSHKYVKVVDDSAVYDAGVVDAPTDAVVQFDDTIDP